MPETSAALSDRERRASALRVLAALVGAQVIARAVDDPRLSHEVLKAADAELRQRAR